MNYPPQVRELVDYNFNDYSEWLHMAKTTFKPMLPTGRFPITDEEKSKHKHLFGTMFYPYDTVADMVKAMDDIGYDPFDIEGSLKEIEKAVKEYDFKYVYFHSMSYGLAPNDKKFYPLYAKCNELGIPVSVQVGHSAEPMPSTLGNPMYMDEIAITFPNLKINLSHTGWPWFREWCDLVWKHPNVYGDISAYMPKSLEPYQIKFMFSGRGKKKVMWGTNGIGLARGKKELMEMEAKDDVKVKILRENAIEFLGLDA